jgi:hypothetical protein
VHRCEDADSGAECVLKRMVVPEEHEENMLVAR